MRQKEALEALVRSLASLRHENEWLEFKLSNADPDYIGERLSAVSNMAALLDRDYGYLIWGIDDLSHEPVGTSLSFSTWKKGGESIEAYWKSLLSKTISLNLEEIQVDGNRVLVAEISRASYAPTTFKKEAYCRVGSYTKKLRDDPSIEKDLWNVLSRQLPEEVLVLGALSQEDLFDLLAFPAYVKLLGLSPALSKHELIRRFIDEGFVVDGGRGYGITKCGALLFAKRLTHFPSLINKTIRLVRYATSSRLSTMGRVEFDQGYAVCYENVMESLLSFLAKPDSFERGIRRDECALPPLSLRELLANALIHQSLGEGYGPLLELFPGRVECANAGPLLVRPDRIIDTVPKARNPRIASFLRRINIGDSTGSGFDKMAYGMEERHLPSPMVREESDGTRVTLLYDRYFGQMSLSEKQQASYDHAVLRYLENEALTNGSLRSRFGLGEKGKFQISRLIRSCLEKGLLKSVEGSTKKEARYLPYWAD